MARHETVMEVRGPWSLATSRAFWEGFTPAALSSDQPPDDLRTVFCAESDWTPVQVSVTQEGPTARLRLEGAGDLEAAAEQVGRFLALDVDARGWPQVGERDEVIAEAQRLMPGLRPCGFHSAYEAAAWSVLSQRTRIAQAAVLRLDLIAEHGDGGAFPAPAVLRALDLDLPGRKAEYLHAVADAALDGLLDVVSLRALDPVEAVARVQQVKGLGPFAAELVVIRGANAPDALPTQERRLAAEVQARYGEGMSLSDVSTAWRPFRTWASVHLRALAKGSLRPGR